MSLQDKAWMESVKINFISCTYLTMKCLDGRFYSKILLCTDFIQPARMSLITIHWFLRHNLNSNKILYFSLLVARIVFLCPSKQALNSWLYTNKTVCCGKTFQVHFGKQNGKASQKILHSIIQITIRITIRIIQTTFS
jgi:hypothetical protein